MPELTTIAIGGLIASFVPPLLFRVAALLIPCCDCNALVPVRVRSILLAPVVLVPNPLPMPQIALELLCKAMLPTGERSVGAWFGFPVFHAFRSPGRSS